MRVGKVYYILDYGQTRYLYILNKYGTYLLGVFGEPRSGS